MTILAADSVDPSLLASRTGARLARPYLEGLRRHLAPGHRSLNPILGGKGGVSDRLSSAKERGISQLTDG